MLTLQTAITFFGISVMLGLTPGPDNIFVLMQSATHGRKAGVFVVLGLCAGLIFHTAAVSLGLAAVFAASAMAFTTLKFVGAAYLGYLAWQAFRAPATNPAATTELAAAPGKLFMRGLVMNLTNPKVVFFFLAFLPQFVNADRGSVAMQLAELGAVFILATLLAFGTIGFFAASLGARLRGSAKAQRVLNRVAGTVFAGLAVRLALSER